MTTRIGTQGWNYDAWSGPFYPTVRAAISSFARPGAEAGLARLAADLETGAWDARYGHLRDLAVLDLGYRLVVAEQPPNAGAYRSFQMTGSAPSNAADGRSAARAAGA